MSNLLIYLLLVLLMSVVTFAVYGWDKWCAKRGARRVPERVLHVLALLGGWPGGLLGQREFRHKTQKTNFLVIFWLMVILHFGLVGAVIYQSDWL